MKRKAVMTNETMATKVATGVSIGSATVGWMAHAQSVVSLLASLVAVVAGLFAIANYLRHGGTLNPAEILRQRKRKKKP